MYLKCSLACLLALFAGVRGLAQSPVLDFQCEALPLRQVLPEISSRTHVKLLVSDELANEPVVLRLNAVPVEEMKAQLAKVFLAEWVPTDQGLELRRTPKVVEPFLKARQAVWAKGFRDAMREYQDILNTPPLSQAEADTLAGSYVKMLVDERSGRSGTTGIAMRMAFSKKTSDMRLMAKILLSTGPDRLAGLNDGRTVFSLDPTPMQERVDGLTAADLDSYVAEHNRLATAIASKMPGDEDVFDGYGNSAMASAINKVVGPVRPLLIFNIERDQNRAWVYFQIFDAKGESIIGLPLPIGPSKSLDAQAAARAQAAALGSKQTAIKLSPVAEELSKRLNRSGSEGPALSPEAIDLLIHPEIRDPMNMGFAEAATKVAEMENRNLIATLQDDNIRPVTHRNGDVKPATFEMSTTYFGQSQFDREEGWLLIHPTNPLFASRTRMDRAPIGSFLTAYNEQGFSTIEDWARLAAAAPEKDNLPLANTMWNVLRGEGSTTGSNEVPILRVFGMLSDEQLRMLSTGQALSFHTMPEALREGLQYLLYGGASSSSLRKLDPGVRGGTPPMLQGIESEPTETVPNGIPATSVLRVDDVSTYQFYVEEGANDYKMPRRTVTIEELASQIAILQVRSDPNWTISGIQYGRRRVISLHLGLSDSLELLSELQEDRVPKGPPMQLPDLESGLPPDVWTKLKKLIEDQKERMKKIQFNPPPSSPPPPPARL